MNFFQTKLSRFFARSRATDREQTEDNKEGNDTSTLVDEPKYQTPMYWTRVVIVEEHMDTAIQTYDVWRDMLEARELRLTEQNVEEEKNAFMWDPNEYRDDLKSLTIAMH